MIKKNGASIAKIAIDQVTIILKKVKNFIFQHLKLFISFLSFKGYYDNALVEYKEALRCFKTTEAPNIQKANIHRFIAETHMKLGKDLSTAKDHLDSYHSISCKLNSMVEIQRAHITLGNYFMSLLETQDPCKKTIYC